jgi:hypothetical protein
MQLLSSSVPVHFTYSFTYSCAFTSTAIIAAEKTFNHLAEITYRSHGYIETQLDLSTL